MKTIKIAILGMVPIFLIAGSADKSLINSGYTDISTANSDYVVFSEKEWNIEINQYLEPSPNRKLKLAFYDSNVDGGIELTLSSKYMNESFSNQVFEIRPIDGFIDGFHGVFGVFTHKDYGEKPFFAKDGFVRIDSLEEKKVQGYLEITFKNDNGKIIKISDTFRNF